MRSLCECDSLSWSCDLWHPATHSTNKWKSQPYSHSRCYQAAWGLKSDPSRGHSLSKGKQNCEGFRGRIDAVLDTDSEPEPPIKKQCFVLRSALVTKPNKKKRNGFSTSYNPWVSDQFLQVAFATINLGKESTSYIIYIIYHYRILQIDTDSD